MGDSVKCNDDDGNSYSGENRLLVKSAHNRQYNDSNSDNKNNSDERKLSSDH